MKNMKKYRLRIRFNNNEIAPRLYYVIQERFLFFWTDMTDEIRDKDLAYKYLEELRSNG